MQPTFSPEFVVTAWTSLALGAAAAAVFAALLAVTVVTSLVIAVQALRARWSHRPRVRGQR